MPLLTNYTSLFRDDFRQCRKDIRPYVPDWAKNIKLKDPPSDTEPNPESCWLDNVGTTEHAPHPEASKTLSSVLLELPIWPCLFPDESTSAGALRKWLIDQLGGEGASEVLLDWCRTWSQKISDAKKSNKLRASLVQSLFLQSLRRLQAFYCKMNAAIADAYILLDLQDQDPPHEVPDSSANETALSANALPILKSFSGLKVHLLSQAEEHSYIASTIIRNIQQQQQHWIKSVLMHKSTQTINQVLVLEKHRTELLIKYAESLGSNSPKPDTTGHTDLLDL
ncbi:hypothetical protein CIB48_g477 [Xylaria polymorpha]|nr:hypothetical protein CIB48_g477 [Xylaria polymorpha]